MTAVEPQAALLFSIGPVQDFIATARKGQDLWFGSWLLSELARTAANTAKEKGAELIVPHLASLKEDAAVANKIVARLPVKDAEPIGQVVEVAVRDRLADLAKAVFDRIAKSPKGRHLRRENADAQVADLLEIAWVVVDEIEGNWGETRRRAELALAARKSLRDFRPVSWGAPVTKSRLDGQRESVIDEAAFATAKTPGELEGLRKSFGVNPAERLCGVGLLKRNARDGLTPEQASGSRVVSTAHIASWSVRRAWSELHAAHADLKNAFELFVASLPNGGYSLSEVPRGHEDPVLGCIDGLVLFARQLADVYEGDELKIAHRRLSDFLREARDIVRRYGGTWSGPSPYYAVVRADGDRMGAWLDGLHTPAEHQAASAALATFAESAKQAVTYCHGHCVFAGGDDVLALLPVTTALECAVELRDAFERAIATAPGGQHSPPTLSVGIQVSHVMDPFRESLEGARKAEHEAKHTYERAAFAVRLDKRSGAPVLVGDKWGELSNFRALQNAQDPNTGSLPRGLAHDLWRVAERLKGDDTALNPIRALEVERVLKQKDVGEVDMSVLWARLGDRKRVCSKRLVRLCNELLVTRALAAFEEEEA